MVLKQTKYNELIYHMKKVKDISKDLSEEDLLIIKEELKIAESRKKIEKIIKERR